MFHGSCYVFLLLATFAYCADENSSRYSFPDNSRENDFSYFTNESCKSHFQTAPAGPSRQYSLFPRSGSPEKFQIRENNSLVREKSKESAEKDKINKRVSTPPGFERKKSSNSILRENISKSVGFSVSDLKTGGLSRDVSPITVKDNNYNPSSVGSANFNSRSTRSWEKSVKLPTEKPGDSSSYFSSSPEVVIFGPNTKYKAEEKFKNNIENPPIDPIIHIGKFGIDTRKPRMYSEPKTFSESNRNDSVKPSFLTAPPNSNITKSVNPENSFPSSSHNPSSMSTNSEKSNRNVSVKPPFLTVSPNSNRSSSVNPENSFPSSSRNPASTSTNNEKPIGNSFTFEDVGLVSIGYKLCTCGGSDRAKRKMLPIMVEICLMDRSGGVFYTAYVKHVHPSDKYIHLGVPKECDSGEDIDIVRQKVKEHISGKILVSFNIGRLITILNLEHPAYYTRDIQSLGKFCDVLFNQKFVTVRRIYTHFITRKKDDGKPDTVHSKAVESLQLYLLFENKWNGEVTRLIKEDANPFRKVNAKFYAETPWQINSNLFHMEGNYLGCYRRVPKNLVAINFVIKNNQISHATIIKLAVNSSGKTDISKIHDLSVVFPENCTEESFSELRNAMCETLREKIIVGYNIEENIRALCSGKKLGSELYDLKTIFKSKDSDVMHLASEYLFAKFDNSHSRLKAKIALQFFSLNRFQPSTTK